MMLNIITAAICVVFICSLVCYLANKNDKISNLQEDTYEVVELVDDEITEPLENTNE